MSCVIAVGHEKGGVGKSSIAVSLAVAIRSSGAEVAILDTDRQASAALWYTYRLNHGLGKEADVPVLQATVNIPQTIVELQSKYDYLVVDIGAGDYAAYKSLALLVDLWIAPTAVGQFDLKSTADLCNAFATANEQHFKGRIPLAVVFNRIPGPWNAVSEFKQAKSVLEAGTFGKTYICENFIRDRSAWRDVTRRGLGISELDVEKATDEFAAVFQELMGQLETDKKGSAK